MPPFEERMDKTLGPGSQDDPVYICPACEQAKHDEIQQQTAGDALRLADLDNRRLEARIRGLKHDRKLRREADARVDKLIGMIAKLIDRGANESL